MSDNGGITSLESIKYLPEEFVAELNAAVVEEDATKAQAYPANSANPSRTPHRVARAPWTTGLSVLCGFWILIGSVGTLSCMASLSRELLPNEAKAQAMAKSPIVAKVVAATDKYKPLLLFQSLFRGGLGVALLVSAAFLLMRRPNAHSFAMTVCACAIFYQFSGVVVSQLVMRSMAQAVETTPGGLASVLSAQARADGQHVSRQQELAIQEMSARIGSSMQIAILLIAIGVLLFKSLLYGVIMLFLNTAAVRAVFAPDEAPPQMAMT